MLSIKVSETATATETTPGKYRICVIKAGQGSSGYYPQDVLERDGSRVFPKGTHSYLNHSSLFEQENRPERSVTDIVGVLESDAEWDTDGLYADLVVLPSLRSRFHELMPYVGMSISAFANVEESDSGPRVTELIESPLTSVDLVTKAGAGGKVVSVLESAGFKGFRASPVSEREKESIMPQEQSGDLTKITEAVAGLTAQLAPVVTYVNDAQVREAEARRLAEEADKVDPIALALSIASKLTESGLAPIQHARVLDAVQLGKSIDEAVAAEVAYADAIRKSVTEAHTPETPAGEWTGQISEGDGSVTSIEESLKRLNVVRKSVA